MILRWINIFECNGDIVINSIINDLLFQLEYGSIWIGGIIPVFKFVGKPIFDKYLENQVEMAKFDKEAEVTKDEMLMQSKIDAENRLHTSQLEYESYKRERVLPKLESINEAIIEHQMHYATYVNAILNRGTLRIDFEISNRLEWLFLSSGYALDI